MQITLEHSPQLQIITFYLPQNIAKEGMLVVQKEASFADSLSDKILHISGVKRCLIAANIVSVQYESQLFESIKHLVLAEIDEFMEEQQTVKPTQQNLSLQEQAEAVADAFIRPTLNRDNGNIKIHNVANSILELSFTGHCAGCPYAQNTLQNVIMRTFQKYMPQVTKVKMKGA